MTAFLIWFLLFGLYLVIVPLGISPFEAPKVVLAEIIIDLIFLTRLIERKIKLRDLIAPQIILFGVILVLSLDQMLLFNLSGAFFGNPFRLQGVFLLWHLMLFSFISKDIAISHIPKALYFLSYIFLVAATLVLGVNENFRAFGTLGEPNALAATTLFIFPFIYSKAKNTIKSAVLISAVFIIILSSSRAGLAGIAIELLFLKLISSFKLSLLKSVIISIFFILFALTLPFAEKQSGWFQNRAEIWQTAYKAGFSSPILGLGFGNIQKPIHESALKLNSLVQHEIVDSAHNFILDWWVQAGIVGVIAVLSVIYAAFGGLIRHKKTMEITAFLGIITAMLFNPLSVVDLLAFWWLIGQGFSRH